MVEQIYRDHEEYEDHRGDDDYDKAFDSPACVIYFDTFGFLSALLKLLVINLIRRRLQSLG